MQEKNFHTSTPPPTPTQPRPKRTLLILGIVVTLVLLSVTVVGTYFFIDNNQKQNSKIEVFNRLEDDTERLMRQWDEINQDDWISVFGMLEPHDELIERMKDEEDYLRTSSRLSDREVSELIDNAKSNRRQIENRLHYLEDLEMQKFNEQLEREMQEWNEAMDWSIDFLSEMSDESWEALRELYSW